MARYYRINGQLYTSVTTALGIIRKPDLELWRGRYGNATADRIRDEAAELGSQVHEWCHAIVRGITWWTHPLAVAFLDWFHATVKEVILAEEPTWNETYLYAGRPDLVAVLKGDRGKPSLIDIKTSAHVWKDMGLQLGAYQEALGKTHDIKIYRRIILHLNKNNPEASAQAHEFSDNNDYPMFLYALNLFNYFKGGISNKDEIIDLIPGQQDGRTA